MVSSADLPYAVPVSHRFKLLTDADAWQLLEHDPFRQSLGMPVEPYDPKITLRELMTPRLGPGTLREPLRLDLEGESEASLLLRPRGFATEATTDLLASPALHSLLSSVALPVHARVVCEAFVFPAGSFGALPRGRKPKGPHAFVWLWWQEHFEARLDPQRSRFRLRYPDGTIDHASYESLEDLAQVKRRAATTLAFDLDLEIAAFADPAVEALDVVPLGSDVVFLSDAMAERLRAAALPGVTIAAAR